MVLYGIPIQILALATVHTWVPCVPLLGNWKYFIYGLKGSCTPLIIENTSVYGMSGYKNCELKYMNENIIKGRNRDSQP